MKKLVCLLFLIILSCSLFACQATSDLKSSSGEQISLSTQATFSSEKTSSSTSSQAPSSSSSIAKPKYAVSMQMRKDGIKYYGDIFKVNIKTVYNGQTNNSGLVYLFNQELEIGTEISITELSYDSSIYELKYYTIGNSAQITELNQSVTVGESALDINLYFETRTFEITYELNGGELASGSPTSYKYGTTTTLKNPTKSGSEFKGWLLNGTVVTEISATSKGNVTLTASWTVTTFDISAVISGKGTLKINNASVNNGAKVTVNQNQQITLSCTSNTGYKFSYYEVNGSKITQQNYTFNMPSQSITVKVVFEAQTYSISYTLNEGTLGSGSPTSYTFGTTTNLVNPSRTGYTFNGWLLNGSKVTSISNTTSGAITLVASWSAIPYSITTSSISGGSITISKTTAYYGDTITLTNTPSIGYSFSNYVVDGTNNTAGSFTMPAKSITVGAVFNKTLYTITHSSTSGGNVTINKTTAYYGDTITLSAKPNIGYIFSSYKIDGTTVTDKDYSFTMPAKSISINATFISGIDNLTPAEFTSTTYGDNTNGALNINSNTIESTMQGSPFAYKRIYGDFYYETQISTTKDKIYNNNEYPKYGIAVNVGKDNFFFYVDARLNGFGDNKWAVITNGYGENVSTSAWYWNDADERKFYFGDTGGYGNGEFVKFAIMRVGATYYFFINNSYFKSLYYPNMADVANVGILSFDIGYTAKETKYSATNNANSVIQSAKAYYNLTSTNPTSITVDGWSGDWNENACATYGLSSGNKYFYASAFTSGDKVYVLVQARTANYIKTSANWWENTNVEMRFAPGDTNRIYVSADGQKWAERVNNFTSNAEQEGELFRVTFEIEIPLSVWGGATPKLGFAFKSADGADYMVEGNYGDWWCGITHIDQQQITVTNNGLGLEREETPSDPVIRTSLEEFGDPFVMLYEDTYYLYATCSKIGFQVSTSKDLINWTTPQYCFDYTGTYTTAANSFANQEFWAPEVRYNAKNDEFVMYYSGSNNSEEKNRTDKPEMPKIGVATSKDPLGPFVDVYGKPFLFCYDDPNTDTPEHENATIDGSIFVDTDGRSYLYYCLDSHTNWSQDYVDDVNNGHYSEICVVELEDDWKTLKPNAVHTRLVKPTEPWEMATTPYTAEGPFMYKHNGKYYLTYSCNVAWNENYGVGLAISNSPTGPFSKIKEPIVTKDPSRTAGTGHSMMFTDKNGDLWCAFHTISDLDWVQVPEKWWPPKAPLLARAYFKDGLLKVAYKNEIILGN